MTLDDIIQQRQRAVSLPDMSSLEDMQEEETTNNHCLEELLCE